MPEKKKGAAKSAKAAEASTLAAVGDKQGKPASAQAGEQQLPPPAAQPASKKRREREEAQESGERMARRRRGGRGGNDSASGLGGGGEEGEPPQPLSPPGRQRSLPDEDAVEEELGRQTEQYLDAVVKVFCVHSEPNFSLPWQRKRQFSSTSSGFVIAGRRILTNAHSVDHHTQVKVRRRGQDTKFIAKVLAQGPECDIALLTVEDPAFWEGDVTPVQFGKLPRLQDSVAVIGYPIGGDSISASSGVVSRIEVTNYSHGATALLGMQIDAAINSGNSGGPAFNSKGECVGIAFQSLKGEDAELIGYVIPVDVVQHFISDFDRNGRYSAFPVLGIEWQRMESPFLRRALGMQPGQKGVLVREVEPTAEAAKELRKGDVLLSFDGTPIANDGTVQFRSGERISFSYLVSKKFVGDKARLQVLRDGRVLELGLRLSTHKRLIPEHLSQRPPSYLICAGFVFTQVTTPYLRSEYGKEWDYEAPVKLLNLALHGKAARPDQQVVVLGHVLAAECTVGYEDLQNYEVLRVNGQAIANLADLVRIVDVCAEKFLTFELEYHATVVIETAVARAATQDIMAMHLIPQDRSADLQPPAAAAAAPAAEAAAEPAAAEPAPEAAPSAAAEAAANGTGAGGKKRKGGKGKKGGGPAGQ